ncbi:hypothetical protein ONE63_004567 [Megalurothrips usitatus]|uniref:Uncharacterized protein n=1 Tax=Megalurothrips usitatus TaxID=439358 RepID=A0AAV7X3Y0_9NEOP|nr:hypothetical protein ONE63_004567 [Megalurothrips usitatus]
MCSEAAKVDGADDDSHVPRSVSIPSVPSDLVRSTLLRPEQYPVEDSHLVAETVPSEGERDPQQEPLGILDETNNMPVPLVTRKKSKKPLDRVRMYMWAKFKGALEEKCEQFWAKTAGAFVEDGYKDFRSKRNLTSHGCEYLVTTEECKDLQTMLRKNFKMAVGVDENVTPHKYEASVYLNSGGKKRRAEIQQKANSVQDLSKEALFEKHWEVIEALERCGVQCRCTTPCLRSGLVPIGTRTDLGKRLPRERRLAVHDVAGAVSR